MITKYISCTIMIIPRLKSRAKRRLWRASVTRTKAFDGLAGFEGRVWACPYDAVTGPRRSARSRLPSTASYPGPEAPEPAVGDLPARGSEQRVVLGDSCPSEILPRFFRV